jgi:pilus assembly protein Flp/PilA
MMKALTKFTKTLWKEESGATAIEYGLIAALIAVVIIAAVTLVGTDLGSMFNNISDNR